ncbi:MAG: universal stress protein, partial [Methanomicrobium sp.]|nr:universal stress protein [Methanomicrobium sp.]
MYSRIVVAMDGSEQSYKALRKGLELASLTGAKVYGLHAASPGLYSSSFVGDDVDDLADDHFKMIRMHFFQQRALHRQREFFDNRRVDVRAPDGGH